MMKKIVSLMLCISILLCSFAGVASAATGMSSSIKGYAYSDAHFAVYKSTSTSSGKVGTCYGDEDQITIHELYDNGWAKISYPTNKGSKTGFCQSKYLLINTSFSGAKAQADSKITSYTKPSCRTSYGYVSAGDKCYVVGDNGTNTQLIYPVSNNGYKVAWVKGVYVSSNGKLVKKGSQTINTNTGSGAVKLNVPYYMQTDSRWKNVKIGTKTIGAIGCTTTCIAMVYSFRTNSTYTPDAMKNKLSYSNNDLKWSSAESLGFTISSCKRVKPTQDMLKLIYQKLKEGKPVIMGCTKSSTSTSNQHWVVITGYTGSGSGTLSMSDFTINDPNSKTRTTLQNFISYRPYMYKILY